LKLARLAAAVAVLAAIFGGYYLYEEVWLAKKRTEDEKAGLLFALNPDQVAKVTIKKPGSDAVEVAREKGIWRIVKPLETEADQETGGRLARVAAELKETRDLGKTANPAEFGLDVPVMVEYFSTSGASLARLAIGARNPLTGGAFAEAGGKGHVSLIDGLSADELDLALIDLREKRFFGQPVKSLVAFEYFHKGMEKTRVEKSGDGKWMIVSPIKAPASAMAVDKLVNNFLKAQATGFHEENVKDPSIYGLTAPQVEFTAYFAKEGRGARMALGSKTGENGVFALWPDGKKVARTADDILKDLPKSILDIRLKELIAFEIGSVDGVTIATSRETLELKKRPSKKGEPELWDITRPAPMPADPVNVSSLLRSLQGVEAMGFAAGVEEEQAAKAILGKPDLMITLNIKSAPLKIRFARAQKEDRYWAAVEGKAETLIVGKAAVSPLAKDSFFLRERRFFTIASADVGRVLIKRLGETFEVEKKGDGYNILRPDKIKIGVKEWTEFVWTIFELRFAGVISEERQKPGDPSFGVPSMAISVFAADGRLLERVEIAKAKGDDKWYRMRAAMRPGLYDVDWFYVEDDVTLALEKILGRNKEKDEQPNVFR
jgi:hypothetical protein